MKKRVLGLILALVMILSLVPTTAFAYSAAYTLPTLTGNKATDTANIATSQVGYTENSTGTVYGNWWNGVTNWGVDYTRLGWCAMFACWCADKAGAGMNVAYDKNGASPSLLFNWQKSHASYDTSFSKSPAAGDFLYFGTSLSNITHVAIVTSYNSSTKVVSFVGGNQGSGSYGQVTKGSIKWGNSTVWYTSNGTSYYVLAYGRPNYGGGSSHTHSWQLTSDGTNHWYKCSCGATQSKSAHNYGSWTITKEATCVATGTTTRKCSICGYAQISTTEKIPHHYFPIIEYGGDTVSDTCTMCGNIKATRSVDRCTPDNTSVDGWYMKINAGETMYWAFCADETAMHEIWTVDSPKGAYDTYGYLYDSDWNLIQTNDDGGENTNFKLSYFMNEGEIYYIGIKFYRNSESGIVECNSSIDSRSIGDNVTWSISNDGTMTISGTGDICVPAYLLANMEYASQVQKLVIEDGVTGICDKAFNFGFDNLTSVTIGNDVKNIGDFAFENCAKLTSISIGNSVARIGNGAFSGCSSLASVSIPNSVTKIGYSAFGCCSKLPSITIPDSVTSIGFNAFGGCSNLTSIAINADIEENMFVDCNNLKSITMGDRVKWVGPNAFLNCSSLTDIYYNSVEWAWKELKNRIEKDGNSELLSANIHFAEAIGSIVDFGDCGENMTWTLDDRGILTISGTGALELQDQYYDGNYRYRLPFMRYKSYIQTICIENGVTSIGNGEQEGSGIFSQCGNLASVTIGNSVTSIGDDAFAYCDKLTSVTIGNSVTSIGDEAFCWCSSLTNVTLPDSMTSIGRNAFIGCSGLTNVTLPDSVTSVGYQAFYKCTGLKSVTIGDSVTKVDSYAFYECTDLTNVNTTDLAAWCKISFANVYANPLYYAHNLYLNGELVSNLVIPDGVTSICRDAFYYCNSLTSVTIPESVTSIGSYAFNGCCNLTDVYYSGTRGGWNSINIGASNAELLNSTIHVHDHNYTTRVTEPTCTERGYTTHTCTACGDSYTDSYLATLDHSWNDGDVTKAATESSMGTKTYTCTSCSATKTEEIPMLTHTHCYTTRVTAPTCTEQGYTTRTCSICGDSYKDSYKAALGHDWDEGYLTGRASYTANGEMTYTCNACGESKTEPIDMKKLSQAKITSVANSKDGITVKWNKVAGATAYQVYRKIGTGSWKLIKTTTSTSFSNTKLTNGSKYQYKVRAIVKVDGKIVNTGAYSAIKTMYRLTRPTLASGTKNIATKKIVVKWNKNTKATGYQIKYVKGGITKTVKVKGAASLSKTLSKLTKGSTYKVSVRSYKTVSGTTYYSAYSAVKSVKVAK